VNDYQSEGEVDEGDMLIGDEEDGWWTDEEGAAKVPFLFFSLLLFLLWEKPDLPTMPPSAFFDVLFSAM